MATTASGPYLPVEQQVETQKMAEEPKKKDPLYAAMFGSQMGSTPAPAELSRTPRLDSIRVDTLDEPVIETLKRDLNNIAEKLKVVLMMKTPPTDSLNDWELWGPLIMCLGMAVTLGVSSNQSVFVFTLVFMLVWLGSLLVTANARLLGYRLSFFQNVCLLGYGLFPLMVVSAVNMILPLLWILKAALAASALGWSSSATIRALNDESMSDRKLLGAYPIFLFYFVFAWLIAVV